MNQQTARRVARILRRAAQGRTTILTYTELAPCNVWTVRVTIPGRQFIMSHATFYDVRLAVRTIRNQAT